MKTKALRILSLLLCLSFLTVMLAACGGGGNGGGTTEAPGGTTAAPGGSTTGSGTDIMDKWQGDYDFEGDTLKIQYNDWVNPVAESAGTGTALDYLRGPDDQGAMNNSVLKEAALRRSRAETALGITIEYSSAGYSGVTGSGFSSMESMASMGEGPDIMIHHNYDMVRAAIKGLLYNALDDTEENYFDLDDEHWYRDMMEENTLDTSKIYMLMGDFFIDNLRMAYGVLVNTELVDSALAQEGGMDGLYDTVMAGGWTYDEMLRVAEAGATDGLAVTDSGYVAGVIGDQGWIVRSFFATSGLDVFRRDDNGTPHYIEDGTEIQTWVEKLLRMETNDYFWHNWPSAKSGGNTTEDFINGSSIFATNQMLLTLEGSRLQSMAGKGAGILPNPKYVKDGTTADTSVNYGAMISDNANSGGIMIFSPNFTMASAYLQFMTEDSDQFIYEYFEVGLKYKYNTGDRTGHITMLEYMRDGICCPMSFLFDNYVAKSLNMDTYSQMIYDCLNNNNAAFNSKWDSPLDSKKNALTNLILTYGG